MDRIAILLFIVTLVLFLVTIGIIMLGSNSSRDESETSSGIQLPDSTMIGAQCPVGCTCFPNTDATMSSDTPTQMCAMLDNNVMFSCPAQCCQPTCINQDVQGIPQRYTM